MRRYRQRLAGTSAAVAIGGWVAYKTLLAPEYHSYGEILDRHYVRWTRNGAAVHKNPGVRVFPMRCLQEDATEGPLAACKILAKTHAISHITPAQSFAFALQMIEAGNRGWMGDINMLRMTGRRERADQVVCPWRYAEDFAFENIPDSFLPLVDELCQRLPATQKELRDITINYRRDGYYRLDPHVDPLQDGSRVCIVSLTSSAVLNLAPQRLGTLCRWLNGYLPQLAQIRTVPYSMDVFVPAGHALVLEGPARYSWTHAIRQGQYRPEETTTLWDHFSGEWMRRSPERWSLVFAFQ